MRSQQHKNFKHQDIHVKQKEPPQKYRLGTISNINLLTGLNRFYMAYLLNVERLYSAIFRPACGTFGKQKDGIATGNVLTCFRKLKGSL